MLMTGEFYKGKQARTCGWIATPPHRRPFQGSTTEGVVNGHYLAWRRGEPTPLRATLDAMYARWLALAEGERLALEWPVRPLVTARATA